MLGPYAARCPLPICHFCDERKAWSHDPGPTGVKYLHEAAHSADLGIYFESNGHGTVLFSPKLVERLQAVSGLRGAVAATSSSSGRTRRRA